MNSKIKIGILGGDMRQIALSSLLSLDGIECALWGVEGLIDLDNKDNIVRTLDWKGTLNEAKAVILPLPVTTDGIRLNCNKNVQLSNLYVPRISEIIEQVQSDTIVFGGKITPSMMRLASEHKVKLIDYYEFEEFLFHKTCRC